MMSQVDILRIVGIIGGSRASGGGEKLDGLFFLVIEIDMLQGKQG
jgi:hypothetical protein